MRDLSADLQTLVDNASEREYTRQLVEQVLMTVHSYDELYTLLRNPNAEIEARRAACEVVLRLAWRDRWQRQKSKRLDKRRAVPALLIAMNVDDFELRRKAIDGLGVMGSTHAYDALFDQAFNSSTEAYIGGVRWEAITALGNLGDKRALKPLVYLAKDKNAGQSERIAAILALESMNDKGAVPALITILQDQSDVATIRGEAAERLASFYDPTSIPVYITALQDKSVDVRFWAAFGLCSIAYTVDISSALQVLDHMVAVDNSAPERWWHVGREAMPALGFLWHPHGRMCEADGGCFSPRTCVISPLLEYTDFQRASWQRDGEEYHWQPLEQSTTLRLDPVWLSNQLKQQWQDVRFNVIEPQPESLLLDWEIDMPGGLLLGGLHRDCYSIMLTNQNHNDVLTFAVWYRSITSLEHTLRLYEWADPGREILPNMTVDELKAVSVY